MSNYKQSSVAWFKKELEDYGTSERLKIDWKTFDELFEQAKPMHKEEVEQFASQCVIEHLKGNPKLINEYYNETFGE